MTATIKYLLKRGSGLFYFRRGIPEAIRPAFGGKREIVKSLETYDELEAIKRCQRLAVVYEKKLTEALKNYQSEVGDIHDQAVKLLRENHVKFGPSGMLSQSDGYAERFIDDFVIRGEEEDSLSDVDNPERDRYPVLTRTVEIMNGTVPITLSEAKNLMIRKSSGEKRRIDEIEAAFRTFTEKLNQDRLERITRAEVQSVAENLLTTYKSATVYKRLNIVKLGIQKLMVLREVDRLNPFEHIDLPQAGHDTESRHTYSPEGLKAVALLVREKLDLQSCRLLGLLINTGCRLIEVAGLELANIVLDHEIPHLVIVAQSNRELKNKNSKRLVPLVGITLDVARLIVTDSLPNQKYAFPQWNKNGKTNSNAAGGACNQMLQTLPEIGTTHSFRHTLNTRLTEGGENPLHINNLMGWKNGGMYSYYGKPEILSLQHQAMMKLIAFENSGNSRYSVP